MPTSFSFDNFDMSSFYTKRSPNAISNSYTFMSSNVNVPSPNRKAHSPTQMFLARVDSTIHEIDGKEASLSSISSSAATASAIGTLLSSEPKSIGGNDYPLSAATSVYASPMTHTNNSMIRDELESTLDTDKSKPDDENRNRNPYSLDILGQLKASMGLSGDSNKLSDEHASSSLSSSFGSSPERGQAAKLERGAVGGETSESQIMVTASEGEFSFSTTYGDVNPVEKTITHAAAAAETSFVNELEQLSSSLFAAIKENKIHKEKSSQRQIDNQSDNSSTSTESNESVHEAHIVAAASFDDTKQANVNKSSTNGIDLMDAKIERLNEGALNEKNSNSDNKASSSSSSCTDFNSSSSSSSMPKSSTSSSASSSASSSSSTSPEQNKTSNSTTQAEKNLNVADNLLSVNLEIKYEENREENEKHHAAQQSKKLDDNLENAKEPENVHSIHAINEMHKKCDSDQNERVSRALVVGDSEESESGGKELEAEATTEQLIQAVASTKSLSVSSPSSSTSTIANYSTKTNYATSSSNDFSLSSHQSSSSSSASPPAPPPPSFSSSSSSSLSHLSSIEKKENNININSTTNNNACSNLAEENNSNNNNNSKHSTQQQLIMLFNDEEVTNLVNKIVNDIIENSIKMFINEKLLSESLNQANKENLNQQEEKQQDNDAKNDEQQEVATRFSQTLNTTQLSEVELSNISNSIVNNAINAAIQKAAHNEQPTEAKLTSYSTITDQTNDRELIEQTFKSSSGVLQQSNLVASSDGDESNIVNTASVQISPSYKKNNQQEEVELNCTVSTITKPPASANDKLNITESKLDDKSTEKDLNNSKKSNGESVVDCFSCSIL
jgi:trimeric autotransporter adhesin